MNANRMIQTIFAGGDADPRDAQARPNSDSVILGASDGSALPAVARGRRRGPGLKPLDSLLLNERQPQGGRNTRAKGASHAIRPSHIRSDSLP